MKFIQVHKWANVQQSYVYVGDLIADIQNETYRVSFHYDKYYAKTHGASLDPKNLNVHKSYVHIVRDTDGSIPLYFKQYLPGEFAAAQIAKLVPNWFSLTEFEQLAHVSQRFGDHHAIQLNAHATDQDNALLSDKTEAIALSHQILNFSPVDTTEPVTSSPLHYLCSLTGSRPKFEFTRTDNGQRWIAKPNSHPHYDEARVRVMTCKLSERATIDTVESYFDEELKCAVQLNFKHTYLANEATYKLLKMNTVSIDILCDADSQQLSYKDIAKVIQEFSADPEKDLQQLHLRAIFDAFINNTRNALDNYSLVDVGVNKWRLAPNFASLPNPNTSERFAIPFTKEFTSRALFHPDLKFAAILAKDIGINPDLSNEHFNAVLNALETVDNLLQEQGAEFSHVFNQALSPHHAFNAALDDLSPEPSGLEPS